MRHLHYYLYMIIHSGTYSRILSTALFEKVLQEIDAKITNSSNPKKLIMFSGHDTNISPSLHFLNLSSFQCIEDIWQKRPLDKYLNCEDGPGFASNLIIEVRQDDQSEPYIQVLYNGKQMNLCDRYSK